MSEVNLRELTADDPTDPPPGWWQTKALELSAERDRYRAALTNIGCMSPYVDDDHHWAEIGRTVVNMANEAGAGRCLSTTSSPDSRNSS
jgi:hypothetical protein